MCILIVDDNKAMRLLIRSILRSIATVIVECADGSESLAAYSTHRPDWVLMDVEMPGMNGFDATKAIVAAFADARIVMVTQYADALTREAAQAAGAIAFVSKDDLTALCALLEPPKGELDVDP